MLTVNACNTDVSRLFHSFRMTLITKEDLSNTKIIKSSYKVHITLCAILLVIIQVFLGTYIYIALKNDFGYEFLQDMKSVVRKEVIQFLNDPDFYVFNEDRQKGAQYDPNMYVEFFRINKALEDNTDTTTVNGIGTWMTKYSQIPVGTLI